MDVSRWRQAVYGLALLVLGLQLAAAFVPPAYATVRSFLDAGGERLPWARALVLLSPLGLLALAVLYASWLHLRGRATLPESIAGRLGFWLAALGLVGTVGSLTYAVLVAGYGANALFVVLAMPYAFAEATLRIGVLIVEASRIGAAADRGIAWGRRVDTG